MFVGVDVFVLVGVLVAVFVDVGVNVAVGATVAVFVGVPVAPPGTVTLPFVVIAVGSPSLNTNPGWKLFPGSV